MHTFQLTQTDLDESHRHMLHHAASEYMINEDFLTQLEFAERASLALTVIQKIE